jgi:hypothetical protein
MAATGSVDGQFVPKTRGDKWRVALGSNKSSGYDLILLLENPETKVSYQFEIGITEDGHLCGQITPDEGNNGPDALVLFEVTPTLAHVSDNWGGSTVVIPRTNPDVSATCEECPPLGPRGFY